MISTITNIYKSVQRKHMNAHQKFAKSKRRHRLRRNISLPILYPIDEEEENVVFDDAYLFDYNFCDIQLPLRTKGKTRNINYSHNFYSYESTVATVAMTALLLMALCMLLAASIGTTPIGSSNQLLPNLMLSSPFGFPPNN